MTYCKYTRRECHTYDINPDTGNPQTLTESYVVLPALPALVFPQAFIFWSYEDNKYHLLCIPEDSYADGFSLDYGGQTNQVWIDGGVWASYNSDGATDWEAEDLQLYTIEHADGFSESMVCTVGEVKWTNVKIGNFNTGQILWPTEPEETEVDTPSVDPDIPAAPSDIPRVQRRDFHLKSFAMGLSDGIAGRALFASRGDGE